MEHNGDESPKDHEVPSFLSYGNATWTFPTDVRKIL